MKGTHMQALTRYIETHRTNGLPGMVIGYQYGYADAVIHAYGTDGDNQPLHDNTLFPVASLTKLATALAILVLVERGNLDLDHTIGTYVPDIHIDMGTRRVRSLLCHTSGYSLDLVNKDELYAPGLTWSVLANVCVHTPPQYAAETCVQYSNIGYGILGIIIERITGMSCSQAMHQLVLQPLGIAGMLGNPETHTVATIGDVRGRHRGTDLETFNSPFWRALALPWGGLCTNAGGALALVDAFMPHSTFLAPQTRDAATQDHTNGLAGGFMAPLMWQQSPWGLGVELRGHKQPHWMTSHFSAHSFGHSGSSGMLVWADPEYMFRIVICGTRAADGGWLLRHGPKLSALLWQEVIQ